MYSKVVVPLDGSKLAECVLPHIEKLVAGDMGEVILISVTERIAGYKPEKDYLPPVLGHPPVDKKPITVIPSDQAITMVPDSLSSEYVEVPVGKMEKQAIRYLDKIATRLEKKKIAVKTQVLLGHPAEQIAGYAQEVGADLILMASHGRSGMGRWAFGSVADKVFRMSSLPVLMIKASVSGESL